MSFPIRQELPSDGAQAAGKSTPQSQIWNKIFRSCCKRAFDIFAYRGSGDVLGA